MAKRWSDDEDNYFVETVNEFVMGRNLAFRVACHQVANDLKRTYLGCEFHWHTNIKQHLEGSELLLKISANNPKLKTISPASSNPYMELYKKILLHEVPPSDSISLTKR
jgi:hypothetical protein